MRCLLSCFALFVLFLSCDPESDFVEETVNSEFLHINIDGETYSFVNDVKFVVDGVDESNYLYAFDSINPGSHHVYFYFFDQVSSEGTLENADVERIHFLLPKNTEGMYMSCYNDTEEEELWPCDNITHVIEITEYGDVGEPVIGTFEGVGNFVKYYDNNLVETFEYSGEFSIIRE